MNISLMIATLFPLCFIGLIEVGVIIGVATLIFGITAVYQNPFISMRQKIVWIATILLLNWVGLLFYYYTFYIRNQK